MTLIKTIAAKPGQQCQHVLMTAEEATAFEAQRVANSERARKAEIEAKIAALEALKVPADIDAQIAALQAQL